MMNMKEMALERIAITLWTRSEMIDELLDNHHYTYEWLHVTKVLCFHSNTLPLPKMLKENIQNLLPFIGFEIYKFIEYLTENFSLDMIYLKCALSKFCWKSKGIIDREKSVKKFIDDPTLRLIIRYKLACDFCLEEDILNLWSELPVIAKADFLSIANQTETFLTNVSIWSLHNEGQEISLFNKSIRLRLESVAVFEFLCSVRECVPEAVAYYFKKIPAEERRMSILKAMNMLQNTYDEIKEMCMFSTQYPRFCNGVLDEIVAFLYNETDKESVEIFARELNYYNVRVLNCFLEWPFWEFFVRVFENLQPHFQREDYISVMMVINDKILQYCASGDYSYILILEEVWKISFKRNKKSVYFFVPRMLDTIQDFIKDDLYAFIMKDFDYKEKEKVYFSLKRKRLCE